MGKYNIDIDYMYKTTSDMLKMMHNSIECVGVPCVECKYSDVCNKAESLLLSILKYKHNNPQEII